MIGLPIADHVARVATLVSIDGALAMAAVLLFLVIRRDRRERARAVEQEQLRELTREIMGTLAEPASPRPAFERADQSTRLAAIGHLGQLVRGEDRERLTQLVEEQNLLGRAIRETSHGSRRKRVEAIRLLGSIGGRRALDALRAAVNDDQDDDVRLEAATMLARLDGLPSSEVLIDRLRLTATAITPLHRALFRMLAARRPAELFSLVGANLPSPVRALLIDALGWTEDYAALDLLAVAARDDHAPVRLAALDAASKLGHPGAAAWIIDLLNDPVPPVRSRAIRACQSMGLRRGLPAIADLRNDPSPWVRLRAQQAVQALEAA